MSLFQVFEYLRPFCLLLLSSYEWCSLCENRGSGQEQGRIQIGWPVPISSIRTGMRVIGARILNLAWGNPSYSFEKTETPCSAGIKQGRCSSIEAAHPCILSGTFGAGLTQTGQLLPGLSFPPVHECFFHYCPVCDLMTHLSWFPLSQ